MKKIKKALISVSDKSNLKELLTILSKFKVEIISSGGTYKQIKKLGYKCTEVSKYTNFPEILDGRLKTLHPKIHGGILSKRNNKKHLKDLKKNKIEEIDLVVVNFYPFNKILLKSRNHQKIIENIDIGGPSLTRAAAKNYEYVTVISSIKNYKDFKDEIIKNKGSTSLKFRQKMSEQAFLESGSYDAIISNYFSSLSNNYFPDKKIVYAEKLEELRYGENPHQRGSVYSTSLIENKVNQLSGKKLSYNNYNDLYSALIISKSLPKNKGTVIVKHANPCGVSINKDKIESYHLALKCDPLSSFGGIVACNFKIGKGLALELNKVFFEIIIGNGFDKNALKILKKKKNLRIIDSSNLKMENNLNILSNFNTLLLQSSDIKPFVRKDFKIVSKLKPNKKMMDNLMFAFNICRFVKSNAIVLTSNFSTVGIGSGQPSRVDSCEIAVNKMQKFKLKDDLSEIYAASDAFFPFVDGIEKLAQAGISGIIQPSGSVRDKEIIKFADKVGMVLAFSKTRHFRH
tara:strand:- start:391 stop:1935 length:1545 start_codon:yes stop_codon:yes gene_type:complete